MLNPDVFCQDIAIIVKILVPYNAFKGNNRKTHRSGNFCKSLRTGW
jgi:hypothetical protein